MWRELKSEEELYVEISEPHPLAVLYETVSLGFGRQQDSKCGVMSTATAWFYQRIAAGEDDHGG